MEAQEEMRRGRFDHIRTIIAKAVALEDELSRREWNSIGDISTEKFQKRPK